VVGIRAGRMSPRGAGTLYIHCCNYGTLYSAQRLAEPLVSFTLLRQYQYMSTFDTGFDQIWHDSLSNTLAYAFASPTPHCANVISFYITSFVFLFILAVLLANI
jgi:hypothetical protein